MAKTMKANSVGCLFFISRWCRWWGFDKYSKISVQFDRQLIGTRKGSLPKIDSLQVIKNIERLIEESKKHNIRYNIHIGG
jgi:hypothetical protein